MISELSTASENFAAELKQLLALPEENVDDIRSTVAGILADVKNSGDVAVLALTNKFDRTNYKLASEFEVSKPEMVAAIDRIDPLILDALKTSISRVKEYHQAQRKALGGGEDWRYDDALGNQLGQRTRAMQRVGVYVPGGKASYPSSVIMTAIPAKVAGVTEVILTVPAPDREISDLILAAAALCGVDRMFMVGGAQAIAALAYGTETIPRVDKIVGPGNIYVATAKEMVFGQVGIDMIAGPSEIVIVADESANPDWLAMDMFAQAEHDEIAQSILVSSSQTLLSQVKQSIARQLPQMQRKDIIEQSLKNRGALLLVSSDVEAQQVVNSIAPEHLELALEDPEAMLEGIEFAGAIFMGHHSAEVVGDYTAGPSHVLPTNGTARFASPLGVYDFQVRSSLVKCSARGAIDLSRAATLIAEQEGLEAHSKSAALRVQG